jgi:hypothetical protein
LLATEYTESMMDRIDEVPKSQLRALREIEKEKLSVARAYNKRVREISFQVGELVRKMILPLGTWDNRSGKWSPSWEGPFKVVSIVPGDAYFIETPEGRKLGKALNDKYHKKYHPHIWQGT